MESYYAVIFSSKRSNVGQKGYDAMSEKMVKLAKQQPGFIDVESARDERGFGITVSYWESLEAIKQWKEHAVHKAAQEKGKEVWYDHYTTRICKIEREYSFKK
ncbi:antibiotic biosynthesis monooxygenase family protein [Scopulibacillus cellulosilyticus]|uniref:Antibiotic biosynthesis monooxygenase family protein n=1 Tax=Scopulibacillus cellulosilyticus TaxID=2665665 RepID=A0ABW2PUV1_9BACL